MKDESSVREVIVKNTLQVLETATMTFAQRVDDRGIVDAELPFLAACMDFHGRIRGRIALAAEEGLARRLATDMIGLDEDAEVTEDAGKPEAAGAAEEVDPADALAELLNIIGMISLEEIFTGWSLRVDPPRPLSFVDYLDLAGGSKEAALAVIQGFSAEEAILELALVVEGGP